MTRFHNSKIDVGKIVDVYSSGLKYAVPHGAHIFPLIGRLTLFAFKSTFFSGALVPHNLNKARMGQMNSRANATSENILLQINLIL